MVARLCYLCFLFSTLPGHFCGTANVLVMEYNGMLQFKMKGNVYTFSE